MTSLTAGDYMAIAGLLATFVALPGGVGIYLLKGMRQDNAVFRTEFRETLATYDLRISQVEQGKLGREDWVRVTASQNNRMNRVSEQLAELSGKMDAQFGLVGGLNRIADAMEKHAESES